VVSGLFFFIEKYPMITKAKRHDDDHVLVLVRYLGLDAVSCRELNCRGEELARHLGFGEKGIIKGSPAARCMSREAKAFHGYLPNVVGGGLSAALQSIGADGATNPLARSAVRRHLRQKGILQDEEYHIEDDMLLDMPAVEVPLPSYFAAPSTTEMTTPHLYEDYRFGGYKWKMAEKMLNDSILPYCRNHGKGCPSMNATLAFTIVNFQRIENISAFQRYKVYEEQVGKEIAKKGRNASAVLPHDLPDWLKRLSQKNGLSSAANATYLLHGTRASCVPSIVQEGLLTRFSLSTEPRYGKGLYFTDSSCKADQFGAKNNPHHRTILVCRVVLGVVEVLPEAAPTKLFASAPRFHSAMAKRDHTQTINPLFPHQLHNEYIVYNECACYPEFVITYQLA
jgi:Poly(ADP-ribose) polymerase catalytic domain/Interferon-induced 6-16 family